MTTYKWPLYCFQVSLLLLRKRIMYYCFQDFHYTFNAETTINLALPIKCRQTWHSTSEQKLWKTLRGFTDSLDLGKKPQKQTGWHETCWYVTWTGNRPLLLKTTWILELMNILQLSIEWAGEMSPVECLA